MAVAVTITMTMELMMAFPNKAAIMARQVMARMAATMMFLTTLSCRRHCLYTVSRGQGTYSNANEALRALKRRRCTRAAERWREMKMGLLGNSKPRKAGERVCGEGRRGYRETMTMMASGGGNKKDTDTNHGQCKWQGCWEGDNDDGGPWTTRIPMAWTVGGVGGKWFIVTFLLCNISYLLLLSV
jgi:hypothetical protein